MNTSLSTFDEFIDEFDEHLDILLDLDEIEPGIWDYAAPTTLTAKALMVEIGKPAGERDPMMMHALFVVWQRCEPTVRSRFTLGFATGLEHRLSQGEPPPSMERITLCLAWLKMGFAPPLFCAEA